MTGRILVLGGGGFIGQAVMAALGDAAVAASRRPVPGVAHVACDITDRASLEAACAGMSAVVNAAAGSRANMLRGTENLIAVAGQGGQHIVHLSSMAVYGAAEGVVREDAGLDDAGSAYAAGKIASEAALRRHAASGGTVSILRPGIVYGSGDQQWIGRLCRLLRAGRLGDLGAAGDGVCNLVHVRDVAAACLACLRAPGGTFHLAARTPPRWNDMFTSLALAIGAVPLRRIGGRRLALERRVLAAPLEVAKRAASRAGWAPGRLPEPLSPSLLTLFARQIRLDPTRADGLGLRRSDDAAGLAEAAAWFTAQA